MILVETPWKRSEKFPGRGLGARVSDCYLCTTEPALSVWLAFKHMGRKIAGSARRMGGRVVEGARLESVYTVTPYRGFESHPIRHLFLIIH